MISCTPFKLPSEVNKLMHPQQLPLAGEERARGRCLRIEAALVQKAVIL
ncbi:hypothetical protein L915_13194 [Phytophthora nicotianae]|uniref:Uncharacterized protein n=1 Tax=Phytophthora nicotianae TaxID=4792 RepID=W2IMX8_PHYNI|nr:hypothetical protein L915_13194 [Phytophthora nicotianae]ETL34733.1 hypothetical protein L916_13079 [Phytophthora nicotianae]